MDKLSFRQINLDFHTSECMENVGSEFSEEDFCQALTEGHISSITLFAKCHHGWSYFPSRVNPMHPTLNTNLLDRQLKVCEKMGVRAEIYISAGIDEHKANEYPLMCVVSCENKEHNTLLGARWHQVCINNEQYLEMLENEVAEVMEVFAGRFDGLFIDICTPAPCVCSNCISTMLELGLNPESREDIEKHRKIVYSKFTSRINSVVAKYNPDMAVFYNCGNMPRDDRSVAYSNTKHLELESLPTGGWGYDHFLISAAYTRVLGREFLGMTGKFHKAWGEFGGFKHPNALIYETSLFLANGAKCSIGDQLHPLGKFDMSTYRMIGKAYSQVEKKEPWCHDVTAVTDVAIFTSYNDHDKKDYHDIGANRMMLEGHYLYNIIDIECDFSDYKVIIFPDIIEFDEALTAKANAYVDNGGKILISGKSGLTAENKFFRDFGVEFCEENPMDNTYMIPNYDMKHNGKTSYLMYWHGYNVKADEKVEKTAYMQDAYFNRSFRRFCSHTTTPYNPESIGIGAVISGNIGYIAWNIFGEYAEHGAYHHKQLVFDMLDSLIKDDKTLTTNLGSNGIVTLMEQKAEHRYINHLLYAVTKLRGNIEVIEDAPAMIDTQVSLRLLHMPKRVYLAPDEQDIPFVYENGRLNYTVNHFILHGMVVIEY